MEIFSDLLALSQASQSLSHLQGRYPGLQLGICTDRDDPMELGRIKAAIAHQGGRSESDWLTRAIPFGGASFPVPQLNDTVAIVYKDGDPHQGFYLGVVQNLINPAGDRDSLILSVPKSIVLQVGDLTISIEDGSIAISGATSVSINGKQITTTDAKDSRNDILVTKGWT